MAVGALFGLVGIVGVIYGAREWAPEVASQHGVGIDAMLDYLLIATGALFLIGHIVLAVLIWQGSRRDRIATRLATTRTERFVSVSLGLLMAVVAEGGVLAIGLPVWDEYFMADPPADAVLVEVTGKQFTWVARYPGPDETFGRTLAELIDDATNPIGLDETDTASADDIVLTGEIHAPVDRALRIRLRSRDVIHSLFVPNLRVKQDAIPGMTPEVVVVPTREGIFEIACAELCGLGHYRMQSYLHVVSNDEFERWLTEQGR
jgi:cytochrome c oxidase subunit 2